MADSILFRTASKFRRDVILRERAAASEMVRFYGGIWKTLNQQIIDLTSAYYADPGKSAAWLFKYNRLAGLRAQTEQQIANFVNFTDGKIRQEQLFLAGQAQTHAEALIRLGLGTPPPGASFAFNRLPIDAISDMIGFLQDGSPLRSLLNELIGDAGNAVANGLVQGLALGLNPKQVARNIRKSLGNNMVRALKIARTEQLRAYRESTHRSYLANSNVVKGWIWISARTSNTCASCFPAGVLVSGPPIEKTFSRHYSGNIVIIHTASGENLPVTPNHPILTNRGWIAAGSLVIGDYVIRSTRSEGTSFGINEYNYNTPVLIEQIAESFGMVFAEMKCTSPDFHGDGKGSDIYIVRTNSLLRNDRNTNISEPVSKNLFGMRISRKFSDFCFGLPKFGSLNSFFNRNMIFSKMIEKNDFSIFKWNLRASKVIRFFKSSSFYASSSQTSTYRTSGDIECDRQRMFSFPRNISFSNFIIRKFHLFMRYIGVLFTRNNISLLFVPQDSSFPKNSCKSLPTNTESWRDLLRSLTGQVSEDCILDISIRSFSGHVYNLQTENNWYTANNIIVHNCWAMHGTWHGLDERQDEHTQGRCTSAPDTITYAEMGFSNIAESVPKIESGIDAFAKLSFDNQLAVLGPAKFAAYQNGTLKLSDLVGRKYSAKWGSMRYEKSLRQLGLDRQRLLLDYKKNYSAQTKLSINLVRKDIRKIATIGAELQDVIANFSSAKDVFVSNDVVDHILEHKGEFDTEKAMKMLTELISNPLQIYKDKKLRSVVFLENFDDRFFLVAPIKTLTYELWLQTIYIEEKKRFINRWQKRGILYQRK